MSEESKEKKKKPNIVKRIWLNISFRIIAGILLLLAAFSAVAISIGYWQFSDRFTDEYIDNAMRISRAAESYLNTDHLADYLEQSETIDQNVEYLESYGLLQSLCDKVGAEFIYVIRPDTTDYAHITFIFNIVNKDSGFDPYPIGFVRDTTNDEYREKYRRLYEGESTEEVVVRDKGYIESGSHITAMIALHDGQGNVVGILCAQRQMDALTSARMSFTIRIINALIIIVILAAAVYGFLLTCTLIRPLKRVTKETARFAENPSIAEEPLSKRIRSHTEIGVLARSVDKMERETLEYIDNLTRVTSEQQRIGTELNLASQIQKGMMKSSFPESAQFEIFASMDPAKEVGGDFYDFFMIDDSHLCMVIADVSGKGIPAALFMMISKILIYDVAMTGASPAEILRIVNERICQDNRLDMFVTVWLGILDLTDGKLTAGNAGHEYPAICRGDAFEILHDKHGFVIGGMSGMKYREYEINLSEGDTIFLYTDGVPEAMNAEETAFGVDRMIDALNIQPHTTPFALLSNVKQQVNAFVNGAPQFDDLTMMCLKFTAKLPSPDTKKD